MGCCSSSGKEPVQPKAEEKYQVNPTASVGDTPRDASEAGSLGGGGSFRGGGSWGSRSRGQGSARSLLGPDGQPPALEDAAEHYPNVEGKSLVAQCLTPELYAQMWVTGATSSGWTVDRAIQSAVDYPILDGSVLPVGMFAGDAESYDLLAPLLKPALLAYHGFDLDTQVHVRDTRVENVGAAEPDPHGKYIQSTRVRAGRQLKNMSFTPACTRAERRHVEKLLKDAFNALPMHLGGAYEDRKGMTPERHAELTRAKHVMFEDPDLWTILGGMARDWPDSRGIFVAHDERAVVWVNEEDHMRCIVNERGGQVLPVFRRWVQTVNAIEANLRGVGSGFEIHPKLGVLTACPSNVGTGGFTVAVIIKLPLLGRQPWFVPNCRACGVRAKGKLVPGAPDHVGVFELSNLGCLGSSEVQLVTLMLRFLARCIDLEQRLERGEELSPEEGEVALVGEAESKHEPAHVPPSRDIADLGALDSVKGLHGVPSTMQVVPRDNFPVVDGHSLVARFLTEEMYAQMWAAGCTPSGWDVDHAIQCAVDYPALDGSHLAFGLFAGDAESYTLLEPLLRPIMQDYHGFDWDTGTHVCDMDVSHLAHPEPDPDGRYIQSTRVRAGRQLKGVPFTPACNRGERRRVEKLLKDAFNALPTDIGGAYEDRKGMTPERHAELRQEKQVMFEDPDLWTILGGMARDWPDSRGIFVAHDERAVVWVNEEDHMRCIVNERGGQVLPVFRRWVQTVNAIEANLRGVGSGFEIHPKLGVLTACPSNVGTGGFTVAVIIKLPLLGRQSWFKPLCRDVGVRVKGRIGESENDPRFTGLFELSNLACLGAGEVQLVNQVLQCVTRCIDLEQRLERGEELTAHSVGVGQPQESATAGAGAGGGAAAGSGHAQAPVSDRVGAGGRPPRRSVDGQPATDADGLSLGSSSAAVVADVDKLL